MTIPGRGDLMPSRRRARHGRGARGALVPLLVLVVLAGAGYAVWHQWIRTTPTVAARTTRLCTPARPVAAPARFAQVHVRVLNTTAKPGLAATTRRELVRRGFVGAGVGNASPRVHGAMIDYPGGTGIAAAKALALVVPQAQLHAVHRKGPVLLEIGSGWPGLASRAAVAKARAADEAAAHPTPPKGCPA